MDSFDRFDESKLPSRNALFSPCSESEYTHATRVWTAFGCRKMADYHVIYLQLDVLQLADLFEKLYTTRLGFYSLDPIHYYTTPGLAWDAVLRISRVDLQLITDIDIHHFVEKSIPGGISMISTRHGQADSSSFPKTYDPSLEKDSCKKYPMMLKMVIYSMWNFTIQLDYTIAR